MGFLQKGGKGGGGLVTPSQSRGSCADDIRTARVSVQPSGDPTDEVRTTLAQLTARAQKLAADDADQRIVCSGRRLYEISKKQAEDSRKLSKRATSSDLFGGSQGSVELFVSRYLNIDIREQQRLLYQLQATQNQLASDIAGIATTATARAPVPSAINNITCGSGGMLTGNDVDLFLEDLKNTVIAQTQLALHQRVKEQVLKQENAFFKAAWMPYYMSLADEAEVLSMRGSDSNNAKIKATPRTPQVAASTFSQLLDGQSPVARAINHKVIAFANIVEHYSPAQWIVRFSAHVYDQDPLASDGELAALYMTAERILDPIQRKGTDAGILSYVAASQRTMEQKALICFLTSTMRIDPSRTDELPNMPAARVLEIIMRQNSMTDAWAHILDALRVGRYDVAVEASRRVGNKCLECALKRLADATPMERHCLSPMLDLRDLYAESQTTENAHRRAVLFLLLYGSTAESHDTVQRVLLQLCTEVAQSLEDALWMRLFLIRAAEPSARMLPVQTLSFTQKLILDDLHDLVSMAHGDVTRVASFLLHALLPASSLRLLLESDITTYVDGFHLALCFNNCDMLHCLQQETPLDLAKHIQRYCSLVLLDANRRRWLCEGNPLPGVATFSYFHKTGFSEAFTEFCAKDSVAVQLFGPLNTFNGQDGLLLACNPSPPSNELLQAMADIAKLAATRNNMPLSIHVLLVQAYSAIRGGKTSAAGGTLKQAVQFICPAMAQAFLLPTRTAYVAALFSQSSLLRDMLRSVDLYELGANGSEATLSSANIRTLETLCTMADMYQAEANGHLEQAFSIFCRLPFIPKSAVHDIDRCTQELCGAPVDIVSAAAAVLPLAFRVSSNLLEVYAQQSDNNGGSVTGNIGVTNVVGCFSPSAAEWSSVPTSSQKACQIVQVMKLVAEWMRRCWNHSSSGSMFYEACAKELTDFEQRYLA